MSGSGPLEIDVDLSNFKDRRGMKVDPGRYTVVVDDLELDTAKSSGNPMINMWLRVIGGEFDSMIIMDRLVLTEKSMFRIVMFMRAIGLPTPTKKLRLNVRPWIGKVVMVDVADGEPYGNSPIKSEVRAYMPLQKGSKAPNTQSTAPVDLEEGLEEFSAPAPPSEPEVVRASSNGESKTVDDVLAGIAQDAAPSDEAVDLDTLDL